MVDLVLRAADAGYYEFESSNVWVCPVCKSQSGRTLTSVGTQNYDICLGCEGRIRSFISVLHSKRCPDILAAAPRADKLTLSFPLAA